MILVITKKLYEHSIFKEFIAIASKLAGGCYERIDTSFIYKSIAADILAYLQLKSKNEFNGYGLFTGLFYNYSSAELNTNITIGDTKCNLKEFISKIKDLLSGLFPSNVLEYNQLLSKPNILFVEDIDTFDEVVKNVPKEALLKVDLADEPVEYTSELIKETKESNSYFTISPKEVNLLETVIKLISTTKDLTKEEWSKIIKKNDVEIKIDSSSVFSKSGSKTDYNDEIQVNPLHPLGIPIVEEDDEGDDEEDDEGDDEGDDN